MNKQQRMMELMNLILHEVQVGTDIFLEKDIHDTITDCNYRGEAKLLLTQIESALTGIATTVITAKGKPSYEVQGNRLDMFHTGYETYRCFVDETEVYFTGAWYKYAGDWNKIAIDVSLDETQRYLTPLQDDLPIAKPDTYSEMAMFGTGEIYCYSKASEFAIAFRPEESNKYTFIKREIDRKSKTVTFYFKDEYGVLKDK